MSCVVSPRGTAALTRGVVFVHSCPRALMPHVEWVLTHLLGPGARLQWTAQPVVPGSFRAELSWQAVHGTAAEVATGLRDYPGLRFEVTEEPSSAADGERFSCTPSLGIFRSGMGPHGDVMISEDRLRAALGRSATRGTDLASEVHALLGTAWDVELEPFRHAGDGAPVRWLHEVV